MKKFNEVKMSLLTKKELKGGANLTYTTGISHVKFSILLTNRMFKAGGG